MSSPELGKFITAQKAAREERAKFGKLSAAATRIQSAVRGFLARRKYRRTIIADLDDILTENPDDVELRPSIRVFFVASRFLSIKDSPATLRDRFERLCKYLVRSVETAESMQFSYIGVALNKNHSLAWIRHIKILLGRCCDLLEQLKPESHVDSVSLALQLHTLIAFTSPNTWLLLHKNKQLAPLLPGMIQMCANIMGALVQRGFFATLRTVLFKGICRNNVSLKPVSLSAILSLATRPLVTGGFTNNLLTQFSTQLLTVPALVFQIEVLTPDFLNKLTEMGLLVKCIQLLVRDGGDDTTTSVMKSVQGTQLLALLANIVHLFNVNSEPACSLADFTFVVTKLLQSIPGAVGAKGSFSQWHELLGWYTPSADAPATEGNLVLIKRQVHLLWNHRTVKILLGDQLKVLAADYEKYEILMPPASSTSSAVAPSSSSFSSSSSSSGAAAGLNTIIKRALDRNAPKQQYFYPNHKHWRKLGSPEVTQVCLVASMYQSALTTLWQSKLDILSGLCYSDRVLHDMYLLITSLGPHCGLKGFLELLQVGSGGGSSSSSSGCNYAPPLMLLLLFCDSMTHYVTILDDIEMYEQQTPFHLNDFVALAYFLNNFLFRSIQENIFDPKTVTTSPLFISMHTLLLCLYRRDCRRQFAPTNHWLVHELKPSHFLSDLEKGKKHTQILLQKMPQIIPHEDRVKLFRKFVQNEKAVLGLTDSVHHSVHSSALIVINRSNIIEDGYRQLASLPSNALKGVIRVRFINQQGLDEAGIDQDGVFKEFLEETIKRVFDPSLNLFRTTSDQRLYPSPTSHMQENHLFLFDFVGRMLGKAVYEGIVVDVPFASFFLSQLLGQTQQALYSCMDELPSLDKELYRSLTFIKHYQGDVADLDLTFSVDEDVMGRIVTHELVEGGRMRPVTNDNKINYIHHMAFFRMHVQIKEQSAAFLRGFRSIVNPDWLSLFSTPELQRLVSGDTAPLDLKDLRKHTQYYGGFHDSHRVVSWLWDILSRDFTEEERGLFLKFVTSCSKPPLLGFAHLEPPFSIRCVEVGDDEDTGDTIGSVIRGFFTIRRKDPLNRRLPTTSTCFNLLKLPNYQKKSTLRDKLRYAVSSNTGFELS